MIYFTSDLHLGHQNIIRIKNRPFETVEEMDKTLLANINAICRKHDTLYILGDISFKQSTEKVNEQLASLNPKLVFIRGNHDSEYNKSLFDEICDYKELKIYHRKIVLSHYPFEEWNGYFSGALHLHGHQHNFAEYNEKMREKEMLRYDVGVDANNFYPISAKQIFEFFGLPMDDYNNSMKRVK